MTMARNSHQDVVRAAGRLFSQRGYHGTSMRDLGRELGLHGSSLYSHISSKEALLVEVVEAGAELFERSAARALSATDEPIERLRSLVSGHIAIVLDHLDEARTFLNEAEALEPHHRAVVIKARDRYESAFRSVISQGIASGALRRDLDVRMTAIYLLSILNAIDRWYRPGGDLDREALTDSMMEFVVRGAGSN
jgi:AcrR family transcriptional regulator